MLAGLLTVWHDLLFLVAFASLPAASPKHSDIPQYMFSLFCGGTL
jgi:hypothetical protein